LNGIDNTSNKSALTKQFKTMDGLELQPSNDNNSRTSSRKSTRKSPEGSWWMKAPLCCVPLRV